ncbi:hypothetical protein IQA68_18635 [Leptospira interrogans serovar Pomona]|nr:hypothetical protein [Leptospira interrogans serovar Pomona]
MRAFTTKQENQQKELRACPFRGLRTDELASLVLDRGQKETGELLHRGFRMQFTETKKQTALAKRTAFRRKAYCPPSSVVCPLKW